MPEPAQRKPLTKKEARLFAKIHAATAILSIEPYFFGTLTDEEADLLENELIKISCQIWAGPTLSTSEDILNHVLSLRKK